MSKQQTDELHKMISNNAIWYAYVHDAVCSKDDPPTPELMQGLITVMFPEDVDKYDYNYLAELWTGAWQFVHNPYEGILT